MLGKLLVTIFATLLVAMTAGVAQPQTVAGASFVEVPFDFVKNEIALQVKINGRGPFTMLLDTDTNPSGIDSALARELGLKLGSTGQRASGGGSEINLVYATRLPVVEIGSLTARDVTAATISLVKLGERLGTPVQGVLGYSFLKDRIVQIDYPARKLRFYARSPFPPQVTTTATRTVISFRYEDELLIDDVYLNGQKVRGTLDTGSSSAFNLTPEAVTALKLEEDVRNGKVTSSVGYNGEHQGRSGTLKAVRLGEISIESAETNFWLPGTGHDKKQYQVNIGNVFFKDYVVTFDFRSKIVVLEKSPG